MKIPERRFSNLKVSYKVHSISVNLAKFEEEFMKDITVLKSRISALELEGLVWTARYRSPRCDEDQSLRR